MRKTVNIFTCIVLFFFIFLSCCPENEQDRVKKNSKAPSSQLFFTQKTMNWYSELSPIEISEDTCDCYDYSVSLLSDTIIPNYYLEYKSKNYRLDSYLFNQRSPSFWYDIFDNRHKKCSFILFFGEKKNSRYSYTVLDITEKGLLTSRYYEIQGVDYKLNDKSANKDVLHNLKNDTVAIFRQQDIVVLASVFFSKDMKFPTLKTNNYLLRDGIWLNPISNPEVDLIMKHFEFIR